MKKAVLSLVLLLVLSACFPLTPPPNLDPILDTAGTAQASLQTAVAQTLAALPTQTSAPPVSTATLTLPIEEPLSVTETLEPTLDLSTATTLEAAPGISTTTPEPALVVSTGTFDVATSTELPATMVLGPATDTLTPGVLTYGTLPPAVPYSNLTLINRAKTKAYISLQVVTAQGGPTIIEYPVSGRIEIQAPVGQYLYVAWVGGRKMVGEFRLRHDQDLELILFRDRVEIH